MAQKYDIPKSESELRCLLDSFYHSTLAALETNEKPRFKGLLEIISSETVIITAIHNIKANRGSKTPGPDQETINEILESRYEEVLERMKSMFQNYNPFPVRRVWIDKPGKYEKRPLGIPAIADRVIQECIRIVLEPIFEAQFIPHSYGFRPMRDAHMAMERTQQMIHKGYFWVVEGDISKFFDNVNHNILIRKMWSMGIRDQRVLMIIKAMLKAGILGEMQNSELGTAQGGIISPLLANVYLHKLDEWILNEWEEKKTKTKYKDKNKMFDALHLRSRLKPTYLIRYADDWVLVTNSKSSAEKWKKRIAKYLNTNLKLSLSDEKTLITNVTKRPIKFVGFEIKAVPGNSKTGYVTNARPNKERLKAKARELIGDIRHLRKFTETNLLIHEINVVNAKIRGVVQYYQAASHSNIWLRKYAQSLSYSALKALRNWNPKWIPANETSNLPSVHLNYATKIPAITNMDVTIGITRLDFVQWIKPLLKNPLETPYSIKGRELYFQRTKKKQTLSRMDSHLNLHYSKMISLGAVGKIYNFEYFMNRAYAFNRDRGKCRVCGYYVDSTEVNIHHNQPLLPMNLVNKVRHLSTVHEECHKRIHSKNDYSYLGSKQWKNIQKFRDMLEKKSE